MADLIQFILVRTDMASMTRGRIAAQCAHAANQMVHDIHAFGWNKAIIQLEEWQKETKYGFGTSYIMNAGNYVKLSEAMGIVNAQTDTFPYGNGTPLGFGNFVIDPTYVVPDGDVVHLVEIVTCGYLFGEKTNILPILKDMEIDFLREKE